MAAAPATIRAALEQVAGHKREAIDAIIQALQHIGLDCDEHVLSGFNELEGWALMLPPLDLHLTHVRIVEAAQGLFPKGKCSVIHGASVAGLLPHPPWVTAVMSSATSAQVPPPFVIPGWQDFMSVLVIQSGTCNVRMSTLLASAEASTRTVPGTITLPNQQLIQSMHCIVAQLLQFDKTQHGVCCQMQARGCPPTPYMTLSEGSRA
jgi:hypothetical protein